MACRIGWIMVPFIRLEAGAMERIGDVDVSYGGCLNCGYRDLKPRNEVLIGDLMGEPRNVDETRKIMKCEEEVRNSIRTTRTLQKSDRTSI